MAMKRIVVIMALLSMFLWCSNSVLASYTPMDGHYTVTTTVTDPGGGFSRYDYAVTNLDQGPQPGYPWVGLDCFIIQVPSGATTQNIQVPAICPTDPCNDSNGGRYWMTSEGTAAIIDPPWYGGFPESGYKYLAWGGQNTIYPQGTTAHFIFDVDATPGNNPIAATYLGTGNWTIYTYEVFQGTVTSTSPVPVPPTVLLLGSGLAGLGLLRRRWSLKK
jgi:hypothetical protein